MSENRSLRVELSVNASAYITGMNRAAESTKGLAREALGVRTNLATITPEINRISGSLRGLNVPSTLVRDIRIIGTTLNGQLNNVHALNAALNALRLPAGGLGGAAQFQNQIRDLEDQIRRLRATAGAPIPLGPTPHNPAPAGGAGAGGGSRGVFGPVLGGAALGNLASNLAFSGLSKITSGIRDTVKATADYETELKTFGAVTKKAGESQKDSNTQMQQAGALAIKLGGDVTIAGASAADAASVLVELAKGGLSVDSSFKAAKGTLQLAAAATVDVGVAAGIQTAALNSFSLGADKAGKVADILSNTAAAASGEITDFAQGMKYSAVSSHQLGLSLTENQAALGLLAQSGMKGSMAGTNFNDVLMRLNPTTKKAVAGMKELGITGFDANGQFEGMVPLIDQLTAAHKRLSPAEFEAANKAAFGAQGMRASGILATQGAKAYTDMYTAIDKGAGVVAFSTAKMSGLGGAFKNVQNQVETAQVVIGEKFSGALQTMLGGIASAIPVVTGFLTGSALGGGLSSIGSWFTPLIDGAKALITTAWPYVQKFGSQLGTVWTNIVADLKPVSDGIGNFFKGFAQTGVIDVAGKAFVGIETAIGDVYKWLKPVAEVVGSVVGALGHLPGPIYAGAAALGAFLLLRGPMNTLFLQLIAGYARVGVAAQGMVSAGLLGNIKRVGAGLLGAFGGPLGLAITAATVGLGFFLGRTKDATRATIDFSSAIDTSTGKLNANAAGIVADKVRDAEKAYVAAGGAAGDYTSAILGNIPAQGRVTATFAALEQKQIDGTGEWQKYGAAFGKIGITAGDVASAFATGGDAVDGLRTKLVDNSGALSKMGVDVQDADSALTRMGDSVAGTGKQVNDYTGSVGDMKTAQVTATAVANNAAAAQVKLGGATAATAAANLAILDSLPDYMKDAQDIDRAGRVTASSFVTVTAAAKTATDAARGTFDLTSLKMIAIGKNAGTGSAEAIAVYSAFAKTVAGIKVSVDDKGVSTFTTATERAFDKYKQDVKDASDQADLFWFKAAGPAATAQQAVYAQAAAMRAIGADLRAQQANAADILAKTTALADITARKNKTELVDKKDAGGKVITNADGTAVQVRQRASDATTDADEAAARRDLAAANATAADSEATLYNARVDAAKQVFAAVAATYINTRATNGDTAARAAATVELKKGRDAYIANYIAGKQASMSDADKAASLKVVTAEANKSADALKLIPAETNTYIDANSTDLIAKAAEAKKKADEATAARTAKFNADTKGAIADIAAFGGNVASIPKSYRTIFDAKVATASENGRNLYNIYNKTTGNWTAQFLTPNQAAAKQKVGYLVNQYDKATGTWTATFATPNQGAAKSVAIGVVTEYDKARGTWTANLSALDLASKQIDAVKASLDGIHNKVVTLEVRQSGTSGEIVYKAPSGQQFQASGGFIAGAGTGTSDSIPAWLSNGEYVVKASQTAKHRPLLESINSGAARFATGGMVGSLGSTNVKLEATGANPGMSAASAVSALYGQADAAVRAAASAAKAAAAAAAAAGSQSASGLLGSQDPSSFGWGVGKNIVPFSFQGMPFPSGVAAGTSSIWTSFLSQLVPTIPGGLRPGENFGFEDRANVNSPGQKSFHAYGLALDLNAPENGNGTNPGTGPGQVPASAGALARRYNMLWGGEFSGTKDPMHFELHESPQQLSGGSAAGAALGGASSGAIANLSGSGVERWRALATKVATAKGEDLASVQVMLNQMSRESSGNPRAINLTDINAQRGTPSVGLLQFIPSTFAANADPGYSSNIYDPESQMRAWYRYINGNYGGYAKFGQRGYGAYADGGLVRGAGSGRSDSNLARVSNGEYIVNAASTSQHLPLLHSINGYASGGLIGSQTALSGRNALSVGPELSNVVSALADIAQAVRDARDAVAPKRDLEAQAWSARNAAKQQQWDNRIAAQNRLHAAQAKQGTENGKTSATERLIDRQKVTAAGRALAATIAADNTAVAKATREWAMARRTATSYANAAAAAERFQSAQQRAYRAQQTYAAQVDKLNGWLTDRSAKLGQLRSERANMMGGISSTVAGFDGGILGHPDTRNTFATILKGQQYDAAQAQKFNVNITKLRKLGLSNGSLNSIASAGVDGGGVTAAALAKATPAQIKQLNGTVNQMHRIGDNVGNVVGGAFYDAGIQSATGFVKGLQSQIGAIQKAMNGAAAAAVSGLTKRLQIHSPSRVMHQLGQHTVTGFVNGVTSGYGAAQSAMTGMVQVPQPFIPQQSFGRSSAAPAINLGGIKVLIGDREITDIVDVQIGGFTVDLGHAFEKAGMQR